MSDGTLRAGIDTSKPSIARVYDAFLGGKDNFDVDRMLHQELEKLVPGFAVTARVNRQFHNRVVRWLTRSAGITQFLDLGSGLPTVQNTHEVAGRLGEESRVVYVDNDPAVIAHGRVLLADADTTFFAAGDLTEPDQLFADPEVGGHLDLDQPLAMLQLLTLHHVGDIDRAQQVMRSYIDRLAPGSYVAISHFVPPDPDDDSAPSRQMRESVAKYRAASPEFTLRTADEIATLLPGLELVEPGLVPVSTWWPDGPATGDLPYLTMHLTGGVARKP